MPDWLTPDIQAQLLDGAVVTVVLSALTTVAACVVGLSAGLGRLHPDRRRRTAAGVYVETFRNVPALILIIFFAFAVPNFFPPDLRRTIFFVNPIVDGIGAITGLSLPYYAIAASVGLTLNTGAHLAELFRAGVATLPPERAEAARTLGASRPAVLRTVIVPDGIRAAFPAISTRLVHNLKNTSLVSFVAVPDLFGAIQGSISETFRATEFLLLAAGLYLVLSTGLVLVLGQVDRRLRRGRTLRRELGV